MNKFFRQTVKTALFSASLAPMLMAPAAADTVKALHSIGADFRAAMIDAELTIDERAEKMRGTVSTLKSLEREVLTADHGDRSQDPKLLRMLKDPERYFIVHAAQKAEKSVTEYWLENVIGITDRAIDSGRLGRR
ncbi:MAG: hypothetical protein GKS00_24655 [Alphaproteobacteria bacterium]|nr:hypothetical protein [Alphaproteobacteria bacterium]